MSEEADNEDRTEEPTQRKLEQAAEKGDIPRSQEIGTFFVLCGFTLALLVGAGWAARDSALSLRAFLMNAHQVPSDGAAFAIVMAVTDKAADIAILRTLGATPRSIMSIFMLQGAVAGRWPVAGTWPIDSNSAAVTRPRPSSRRSVGSGRGAAPAARRVDPRPRGVGLLLGQSRRRVLVRLIGAGPARAVRAVALADCIKIQ